MEPIKRSHLAPPRSTLEVSMHFPQKQQLKPTVQLLPLHPATLRFPVSTARVCFGAPGVAMAEILATMVVKPLVSMVATKAGSHLLDQYQVMKGMEKLHEDLKRKLLAILDTISDAEEKAADKREGAKAWLEKVRKVSYQVNDALDECKYEALRRKAKEEGHYKELGMDVIKLFPSHNHVVFRYKIANKLRMILQEIDVLIKEKNEFKLISKSGPPEQISYLREYSSDIIDPTHIASKSRAREKDDVVHRLLSQANSSNLKVLPIVGMGGLGKTTLAQLVYNDPEIQKHFELRLWVCVSDDFDVDSLADKILKENACEASGSSALGRLQNAVSGKRYLLVLDDVWNRDEHKWERLKYYLQHGGSGSSVLTTTRDEAAANLMMGTSTTKGAYKLESLGADFIEEIIKTRAFGSTKEEEWPGELVKMVGEVAKRCAGSPLAAKALGSVLRMKNTNEEWESVLRRSSICDEENKVLPVLRLSYNDLPSHMRQCFAFCAMFPKDYVIDVEMLIQLWMANGFIPEKQGERPEIVGKNIFVELASRSFFQDVEGIPFQFNNKKVPRVTCKIHDLMHDVALSAMGEECAAIATHPSEGEDALGSVRHLYLSIRRPETLLNTSLEKGSPAFQTLICDESPRICGAYVKDLKILSKYNSIRALKIAGGSILRPKYLHHLRYLDLSNSYTEALPEDISILYHLQTLNLSGCYKLERLPKGLKYLTALRHLYTHACWRLKSMPSELGCLTSLQTLTYFVAGTDSGCSNVGELKNLDIGGTLKLSKLENVKGADAQAAGLGNKKKLTELELSWTRERLDELYLITNSHNEVLEGQNIDEVLEGLKPHDGLKALRINYYGSSTFPAWMSTLRCMVELVLYGCKRLEKLPALWQELPALQVLHLRNLESFHCLCSGGTTSVTFPDLKVLTLVQMAKFETWWETHEVQGAEPIFPKVEELEIQECKSLIALPKAAPVISGVDPKCRSAFPALRKMKLEELTVFERWEVGEEISGEEVMFPQLEELSISNCGRLSALPKGSFLAKQSFGRAETVCCRSAYPALKKLRLSGLTVFEQCKSLIVLPKAAPVISGVDTKCRSAFPALRKMKLTNLTMFERWEAGNVISGEEVTFPRLEELSISDCHSLSALPKGFPALRKLDLFCLSALEKWGLIERTPGEEVTLPQLENLSICGCPNLTDLPEAPRLSELSIFGEDGGGGQQISLEAASRCIPSLSRLILEVSRNDTETTLLHVQKKWNDVKLTLPAMTLYQCDPFFSSHSSALALWTCFTQLVDLKIRGCNALDCWPENVFQVLVCLRNLDVEGCSKLTGRTQAPQRGGILPRLESLMISWCNSLVEVPNLPASLKELHIEGCDKLESIVFSQQEDTRLVSGEGVVPPDTSSLIPGCSNSEATSSTAVLSSAANHRFPPCPESLYLQQCYGLSKVANLPPSIKTLSIYDCSNLQSISGQLDGVQKLIIDSCERLVSLPDGPQAYSCLRVLEIRYCDGIKLLPASLQSHLNHLQKKDMDARFEDLPEPPESKTLTRAIKRMVHKAGKRLSPRSLRQKVRWFRRSLRRKVTLGWCARNSRPRTT